MRLSADAARRVAIVAQGFGGRSQAGSAAGPGARAIEGVVRRLGLLQLDSVNVFARAHYVPVYSRLGPYETRRLDLLAGHAVAGAPAGARRGRRLAEYWAHEASLVPFETWPLLAWRMAAPERYAWGSMVRVAQDEPALVESVLALVSADGPVRARATGFARGEPRPGAMWNWHDGKRALEYLFFTGAITAAARVNFERLYDLTSRVLPGSALAMAGVVPEADAQRELVRISARALGVATEPDLGDYFRLPRAVSRARVAELVASGELVAVDVAGWGGAGSGSGGEAFLWHEARRPRASSVEGVRALLCPFDPLVFFRPRVERLFGFRYRIEIYVPEAERIHGYYVLPFLLGDRLVARVDVKSDRALGVLRVRGAFLESSVVAAGDRARVTRELADELALAAGWLGLTEGVAVDAEARGDLAGVLRAAVGRL